MALDTPLSCQQVVVVEMMYKIYCTLCNSQVIFLTICEYNKWKYA